MTSKSSMPRFPTREAVDFVIVGSGAAGGVLAKELSTSGFKVVVMEQGRYRTAADFSHDELGVMFHNEMNAGQENGNPQTFRHTEGEVAKIQNAPPPALYAQTVGGSSVHLTGNYWRFRPVDFNERSLLGSIEGTGFADWPITYEELEPYYTRVDWEIGVSGAPAHSDPPRSKPYPVPPMPIKSAGVLLEKGARKLGLHADPAPVAILSQPHNGRPGCIHCGFCLGFGCEANAKSSTLATMIPLAEATGNCEIRAECTVHRVETDANGRASEVLYWDVDGNEQAQRARAVILCANGAETARLLLLSDSGRHPDGLANSSGLVGKNLMFNGHSVTHALFDEPLHEYKSIQCTRVIFDFYDSDPKRGFYGGGGIDARPFLSATPIFFAMGGVPPDVPKWGAEYKEYLARNFVRKMVVLGNGTSLPLESNNISLDPNVKDRWGRPALRVTYKDHPDDHAMARFMQKHAVRIMDAAGATKIWNVPVEDQNIGAHLLGTCRMGNDTEASVVDRYHRSHEVPNLFICDGSGFVTSGRGQPTMTIQALAFRAAEHIARFAKNGDI